MVADRKMLLLESRFRNSETIYHQLILYINVCGYFDSYAKHPKLVGQGFDLFTCNATTYYFRSERLRFYGVMALAVPDNESTVNVNYDTRV